MSAEVVERAQVAESAGYAFVRHVAEVAPIFTAPRGGGSEFARPLGWEKTPRAPSVEVALEGYLPGSAVCAVTGDLLAVVDVDPRNGGDIEKVRQLLDALNVTVFAEVRTPSGGRHFYVAGHSDLPSSHRLTGWPGIDVQSHRANVFLPGTRRPKYNGAGYSVVYDNLLALADGGDPVGADALADWVAEHRPHGPVEAFDPSPPWDGTLPDRRQRAYLEKVLASRCEELAPMLPESGRNTAAYNAGLKCGNYVAGAGMDESEVVRRLLLASEANGLVAEDGAAAVTSSIHSGLRNGKRRPRAVPDAPAATVLEVDGVTVDSQTGEVVEGAGHGRRVVLTAAASIKPRRVQWLWEGRLAVGTLGLLAGREGLGKSTLAYWLAAQVTRGLLPGEHYGTPKGVLVCATEDSWEHTIVPRLIAADADLTRVYRVEVLTDENVHYPLSVPRDLLEVERNAREVDAALLLLDPLMSRLSESIDTHRDGEVRRALEPLVACAGQTGLAVFGLIHHNKSGSTDPMQLVMGSRAFTAVARSVHTVVPDPDDETERRKLFGTPKNNLGRDDQPTLAFTLEGFAVPTDDGDAWTGRVVWGEERAEGIAETMRRAAGSDEDRSAISEAAEWLADYVESKGGVVPSKDAKAAGKREGHSDDSLKRARARLRYWIKSSGFPRSTYWGDPAKADADDAVGAAEHTVGASQ